MNARDVTRRFVPASVLLLLVAAVGLTEAQPTLQSVLPAEGSTVRELGLVEVQFSEPVLGVNASDLLINGIGATNVTEFSPGQFVFSFAPPAEGAVAVSWRPDHGIVDQATASQPFLGGSWTYLLNTELVPSGVIISELMAANQHVLNDEDGEQSDWIEIYNGSEETLQLDGWFLTDEAGNLSK
jgi:hypothetical protein